MKIALISVYNTSCGIATYNKGLISELSSLADVKIFAEKNNCPDTEDIKYCWDRDEHPKMELIDAIDDYNPDVILFSHEFGLFPKAYYFTCLVSYFKFRKYKVITIFHSIYEHLDKTVHEASVPNIIVHTDEGKRCLVKRGISETSITIVPHGTTFYTDDNTLLPKLWNTWGSEYTIFQPGFLFHYKGHLRMLDIVAKLKEKYPTVHYIVQGSENPKCQKEHDNLYGEIMAKAKNLNLLSNITINRGFVSDEVLLSYIRTVKCCVLPYLKSEEHEVRAASGMNKMILATEIPLVVTDVHLFDDVQNIIHRCKSDDELYDDVNVIFSNQYDYEINNKSRIDFLHKTSWTNSAQKIMNIINKK